MPVQKKPAMKRPAAKKETMKSPAMKKPAAAKPKAISGSDVRSGSNSPLPPYLHPDQLAELHSALDRAVSAAAYWPPIIGVKPIPCPVQK